MFIIAIILVFEVIVYLLLIGVLLMLILGSLSRD